MAATKSIRSNPRSASTTWDYPLTKIRKDPAPQAGRAPKAPRWHKLTRRDAKARLTITLQYRGGAEAWWLVEARGSRGAFPGVMSLHDVMREINDGSAYRRD